MKRKTASNECWFHLCCVSYLLFILALKVLVELAPIMSSRFKKIHCLVFLVVLGERVGSNKLVHYYRDRKIYLSFFCWLLYFTSSKRFKSVFCFIITTFSLVWLLNLYRYGVQHQSFHNCNAIFELFILLQHLVDWILFSKIFLWEPPSPVSTGLVSL